MNDDVRKAAERVRIGPGVARIADFALLSHAFLAEHPADDGEAIDEQFLIGIGWEHQGSTWYPSMTAPSTLYIAFDECGACDLGIVGSRLKAENATRGDLRRLCTAFDLKSPTQTAAPPRE